jgi:hypothetical protein
VVDPVVIGFDDSKPETDWYSANALGMRTFFWTEALFLLALPWGGAPVSRVSHAQKLPCDISRHLHVVQNLRAQVKSSKNNVPKHEAHSIYVFRRALIYDIRANILRRPTWSSNCPTADMKGGALARGQLVQAPWNAPPHWWRVESWSPPGRAGLPGWNGAMDEGARSTPMALKRHYGIWLDTA